MNKKLLMGLFLAGSLTLNAQITETVSIGAQSVNSNWYSLSSGSLGTSPINNWDIAFQIGGLTDAGIRVNGANNVALFIYEGDYANVDTTGMEWNRVYNSATSWSTGAFNRGNDTSNMFDYGWGAYNPATHGIDGNKVYVIQLDETTFKKLQIVSLSDYDTDPSSFKFEYSFKYANLDGTDEVSTSVKKPDYEGYNFVYYSIVNDELLQREVELLTNWDLYFGKYIDMIENPMQPGVFMPYGVTGVLAGPSTQVAQVDGVADVASYNDWFNAPYSSEINTIGSDWKGYNMTTHQYDIVTDRVYFVKTQFGEIWKLIFTNYGGSSTGDMTFTKELVSTLGVDHVEKAEVVVYPNPATDKVSFILNNMADNNADITIMSVTGQIVYENTLLGNQNFEVKNIDISDLNAGVYFVKVKSGDQHLTKKMIVK